MLKIEIDEEIGKGKIQMSGSLLDLMKNITVILKNLYYNLESVEEQEVFRKLLKGIVNKQIYVKDKNELDEDEDIEKRDTRFNKIINEIDKMEEEK